MASAAGASPETEGAAGDTSSSAASRVTVVFTGDILFGRYLRSPDRFRRVAATKKPFADVTGVLSGADIAFGNIESPVMVEPKKFDVFRSLTFRAEPSDAEIMAEAGYDVVSVANNHTMNLGTRGAAETPGHVRAAGMVPAGAGQTLEEAQRPAIVEVKGVRVAFICYTVWSNGRKAVGKTGAMAKFNRKRINTDLPVIIRATRDEHEPDFVVVSLHWGDRRRTASTERPTAYCARRHRCWRRCYRRTSSARRAGHRDLQGQVDRVLTRQLFVRQQQARSAPHVDLGSDAHRQGRRPQSHGCHRAPSVDSPEQEKTQQCTHAGPGAGLQSLGTRAEETGSQGANSGRAPVAPFGPVGLR